MSKPLALSDDQMSCILRMAAPLAIDDRANFLHVSLTAARLATASSRERALKPKNDIGARPIFRAASIARSIVADVRRHRLTVARHSPQEPLRARCFAVALR
jgi:hypothetical protein